MRGVPLTHCPTHWKGPRVLYLLNVAVIGQTNDNIEFFQLDIDGVIVLDKEHFDAILQNLWSLLNNEVDVAQGNVLDLGLARQECHQGRSELLCQSLLVPIHQQNTGLGQRLPEPNQSSLESPSPRLPQLLLSSTPLNPQPTPHRLSCPSASGGP